MSWISSVIKSIRAYKAIATMPNGFAWMKLVNDIMEFATEANQRKRPMLTKICSINMSEKTNIIPKNFDIVSLWAGIGDANPIARLQNLRAQIEGLREILTEAQKAIPDNEENNTLLLNVKIIMDATK